MSKPQQAVPSSTRTLPVRPVQLLASGAESLLPPGSNTETDLQQLGVETQPDQALPDPTPTVAVSSSSSSSYKAAELPLLSSLERLAAGFASTLGSPEAGLLMSASDTSSMDADVAAVNADLAAANLEAGMVSEEPQQRILATSQQGRPAAAAAAAAKPPAGKPAANAGKPAANAGKPAAQPAAGKPAAAKPAAAKPAAAKPAHSKETVQKPGSSRTSGVAVAAARLAQQQPVFDEDYTPGDDSNVFIGPDAPVPPADTAPVPPVPSAPQESTTPLYITPAASFESLTEVNLDQPLLQIPQSFLGISHEWTHVEEINNIPGYKDIIRLLTSYGSGPFNIRIGGGSTDKQAYVFPQYVYDALRQVHEETGAQYIMSVNLEKGDMELARAQLKMAKDNLPAAAILTTEIGNEVGVDFKTIACKLQCTSLTDTVHVRFAVATTSDSISSSSCYQLSHSINTIEATASDRLVKYQQTSCM
jgi:predicted lipid-binding transport protein (Tim44 family)